MLIFGTLGVKWFLLVNIVKQVQLGVPLIVDCIFNISTQLEHFDSNTITSLKFKLQTNGGTELHTHYSLENFCFVLPFKLLYAVLNF